MCRHRKIPISLGGSVLGSADVGRLRGRAHQSECLWPAHQRDGGCERQRIRPRCDHRHDVRGIFSASWPARYRPGRVSGACPGCGGLGNWHSDVHHFGAHGPLQLLPQEQGRSTIPDWFHCRRPHLLLRSADSSRLQPCSRLGSPSCCRGRRLGGDGHSRAPLWLLGVCARANVGSTARRGPVRPDTGSCHEYGASSWRLLQARTRLVARRFTETRLRHNFPAHFFARSVR
mmetsp:Transcript_13807/g.37816  ORF Transcript_13807/g.37816 Transcript_13807/m.37816 type:complete len:231 (+) Transcript_13807:356-1048(+)